MHFSNCAQNIYEKYKVIFTIILCVCGDWWCVCVILYSIQFQTVLNLNDCFAGVFFPFAIRSCPFTFINVVRPVIQYSMLWRLNHIIFFKGNYSLRMDLYDNKNVPFYIYHATRNTTQYTWIFHIYVHRYRIRSLETKVLHSFNRIS